MRTWGWVLVGALLLAGCELITTVDTRLTLDAGGDAGTPDVDAGTTE